MPCSCPHMGSHCGLGRARQAAAGLCRVNEVLAGRFINLVANSPRKPSSHLEGGRNVFTFFFFNDKIQKGLGSQEPWINGAELVPHTPNSRGRARADWPGPSLLSTHQTCKELDQFPPRPPAFAATPATASPDPSAFLIIFILLSIQACFGT